MFDAFLQDQPKRHRGRWPLIAVLAVAELGLVRALDLFQPPAHVLEHSVEVRLVGPAVASPIPPPARAVARAASSAPSSARPRPPVAPLVQPREFTVEAPSPGPPPEPEPSGEGAGVVGGLAGGSTDGVVGGAVSPVLAAAEPILARPADLAAVRAGLARQFVYPPEAIRRRLEGRVVLAFTLLPDGSLQGLAIRSSSGHLLLDEAALRAAREAAPFDPPGVTVLVVVPVVFRLS